MSTRSGSNSIPYWGRFATAAGATGLPNVAGATVQLPAGVLETGDVAFVTATGLLYVCTTATPGAAVWAAQQPVSFGNTATAGPASAAGSASSALRSDATIPIAFGGDTQGDLAVRGAAAYQRLAAVAAGQVLASAGVGALPAYTDPQTLLGSPFISPNTFDANYNVTSVTSPLAYSSTAGGAISISAFNSLTKDILYRVVKTNTGTNAITAVCPTLWNINGGTVSTNLQLPGSNIGAIGIWWVHTKISALTIYVHPATVDGAHWWYG